MKALKTSVLLIGFLIFGATSAFSQWYGTNTFEFQLGNLPYERDTDFTTSYNQLNLYYDSDRISLYGKLEQFFTPIEERNYFDLTQKRFQFQDDNFRLRVGNFYETLGRGLLLRSYDIPGSVFEDEFNRVRYAFFQDLEGVAIDYTTDQFEIKALRARPLFNPLPPNFEPDSLRRPDLVEAIQGNFYATDDLNIGGILMRSNSSTSEFREFGAFMMDFNLNDYVQLFSEYAFETKDAFSFDSEEDAFGFYAGTNFYYDAFGGSIEYKSYNNLRLGNGFNDPPSLIKEHTYPVLNRSTHVLNTSGETGIQIEVYYNFVDGHSALFNYTRAEHGTFVDFDYVEYFFEGLYQFSDRLSFKTFFDYAIDDENGEEDRIAIGFIPEIIFQNSNSFILDLQYQQFVREEFDLSVGEFGDFVPQTSRNYYISFSYSFSSDFTISSVIEASTDLQLTDNPRTIIDVEDNTRYWVGGNALYKANSSNTIEVFAGKRRGGPACTSGICYEILDFEGVELRLTTRF